MSSGSPFGIEVSNAKKDRGAPRIIRGLPRNFPGNKAAGAGVLSPSCFANSGRPDAKEHHLSASERTRRFEAIALPHLDAAYNLARWLTRADHDARDVVQES